MPCNFKATNCKVIFTRIYIDSSPVKGKKEDSRRSSWTLLVLAQREAREMYIYLLTWMAGMGGIRSKINLINFSCTSGNSLICLCTCSVCGFYIFKQSKYIIIMRKRQKVLESTIFLKNEREEKAIDVNIAMFLGIDWVRARRMKKESSSQ